ncbi:hypothetical protein ABVK25_011024 [Lepraria finkii]|uniref:Uncharacterized protein n=1 Tax=Lepraria finkii TaxID=1340010 RepID=A0ABR4AUZ7_9LECA
MGRLLFPKTRFPRFKFETAPRRKAGQDASTALQSIATIRPRSKKDNYFYATIGTMSRSLLLQLRKVHSERFLGCESSTSYTASARGQIADIHIIQIVYLAYRMSARRWER